MYKKMFTLRNVKREGVVVTDLDGCIHTVSTTAVSSGYVKQTFTQSSAAIYAVFQYRNNQFKRCFIVWKVITKYSSIRNVNSQEIRKCGDIKSVVTRNVLSQNELFLLNRHAWFIHCHQTSMIEVVYGYISVTSGSLRASEGPRVRFMADPCLRNGQLFIPISIIVRMQIMIAEVVIVNVEFREQI